MAEPARLTPLGSTLSDGPATTLLLSVLSFFIRKAQYRFMTFTQAVAGVFLFLAGYSLRSVAIRYGFRKCGCLHFTLRLGSTPRRSRKKAWSIIEPRPGNLPMLKKQRRMIVAKCRDLVLPDVEGKATALRGKSLNDFTRDDAAALLLHLQEMEIAAGHPPRVVHTSVAELVNTR